MPDPGTVSECYCTVCNSQMLVERDCYGSTSSIMAMSGSKRKYDFFQCPLRENLWHKQVIALRRKAMESCSANLREVLLLEADEVLKNKVATVKAGSWSIAIN